jgi:hypothetical protein
VAGRQSAVRLDPVIGSAAAPTFPAKSSCVRDVDYHFLRQIVGRLSQNVLDSSRDYLFETRLAKVLRNEGMTHLEELVEHLKIRKNPSLERTIAESMTINETSFFRDGRPFELLRIELLPALIEARRISRTLRFWSAASSTGQEAYSIGMLLHEHFPHLPSWNGGLCGGNMDHAASESSPSRPSVSIVLRIDRREFQELKQPGNNGRIRGQLALPQQTQKVFACVGEPF